MATAERVLDWQHFAEKALQGPGWSQRQLVRYMTAEDPMKLPETVRNGAIRLINSIYQQQPEQRQPSQKQ